MTASTSTITTTSFATTTVTATSVNDASTTITTTTTETATATASPSTTTTTTSTTTVTQMATATGYAQCAANNFADKLNGNNIYLQAASSGNYGVKNIAGVTNALDCCVACATTTDCSVSIYTVQEGGCYLLTNCGLTFPTVQDISYDWIVNNGCGKAVSS
ncbi:uncharacterized protein RHO25_012624 [Cercospora beticola]|nr:hypothetical protein RHO25_012624 [Cercospora beticola]